MRKFTVIAALLAVTAMSALSAANAGEQKKFVYLPQNLNNPFYTPIADTFAEDYAKEGAVFTPLDPNTTRRYRFP